MLNTAKGFALGFALFILLAKPSFAATLSVNNQDWAIYTGLGSVANGLVSDPLIGTDVTVLNISTSSGLGFGVVQSAGNLPVAGVRYAHVWVRSNEPFMFYFLTRDAVGKQRYVQYYSGSRFKAYTSAYDYVMAPHTAFGGTGGAWQELWVDLQADLRVMVPNVTITSVDAFAIRGNLSIAKVELVEQNMVLPESDPDADQLTNATEIASGTNIFRLDSDFDLVADLLELSAGYPCADPLSPSIPSLNDFDRNGATNRDAVLLLSPCNEAFPPMLYPSGWRIYANPGDGQVSVNPVDNSVSLTHSAANPMALGAFNSSPFAPYPDLHVERDQLVFGLIPADLSEDFYLFVLVKGSDGNRYYLSFPRSGNSRAVVSDSWVTYLVTPLEAIYGYDFSVMPLRGEFFVYIDLTAAMRAFYPMLHVKEVNWVAVRGRLSMSTVGFGPLALFQPPATVNSGQTFSVSAHDPFINWSLLAGTPSSNLGSVCRYDQNVCDAYLWEDVSFGLPNGLSIQSPNASATLVVAPQVTSTQTHTLRIRTTQATAQHPEGIVTGFTATIDVVP